MEPEDPDAQSPERLSSPEQGADPMIEQELLIGEIGLGGSTPEQVADAAAQQEHALHVEIGLGGSSPEQVADAVAQQGHALHVEIGLGQGFPY